MFGGHRCAILAGHDGTARLAGDSAPKQLVGCVVSNLLPVERSDDVWVGDRGFDAIGRRCRGVSHVAILYRRKREQTTAKQQSSNRMLWI